MHESWFLSILFAADLRLAELGAIAAICVGIYFEFVSSRIDVSKAFPNLSFSKAPDDLTQMVEELAKLQESNAQKSDYLTLAYHQHSRFAHTATTLLLSPWDSRIIRCL